MDYMGAAGTLPDALRNRKPRPLSAWPRISKPDCGRSARRLPGAHPPSAPLVEPGDDPPVGTGLAPSV